MITAYHRPHNIQEALVLIARSTPRTLPLGGGTLLSHNQSDDVEVVDLQYLGLNQVTEHGKNLEIGAATPLQRLIEDVHCPPALMRALKLEAPLNLRNLATIAGTIVACTGRSPFSTALLALDAKLTLEGVSGVQNAQKTSIKSLGDLLPMREQILPGNLITTIEIPLNTKFAFEYVSRTPADKPIISVALAQWPSGRTRLTVGGFGNEPTLAMDGPESEGFDIAARNACHGANDDRGSAEYRMDIAATLARRCLSALAP